MTNFLIIILTAVLLAGSLTGWYITREKYRRRLKEAASKNASLTEQQMQLRSDTAAEKEALSALLDQLADHEKELKKTITDLNFEKTALTNDLENSLNMQASLKAKYDALYIKHIELTNERNRLKEQIRRQGPN